MLTLFALAREGYTVRVMDENQSFNEYCAKETVTFTTYDKDKAIKWAKEKYNEGYNVTISFNQQTGEFTCVATR